MVPTMASVRSSFHRGVVGAALLVGMAVALAGCSQRLADPRYVRNDTQYGVTRGLFRSRWWNFYERGVSFLDGKFYQEAIRDFRSAIDLRPDDHRRARTYGLHFVDYFPHRELGIALLASGNHGAALKELQASLQHEPSAKAKFYLNATRAALLQESGDDHENPKVTITSISDGAITNKFVLDVRGQVTDDTYVKWIRINGRKQFIELADAAIPFHRKLLLKPGVNTIDVAAGDLLDKKDTQTITVILDREGPLFSLRSPDDEAVVRRPSVRWAGRFRDRTNVVEVKLNGRIIPIVPGRQVEIDHEVSLQPGRNVLTFAARDRAGNVTSGQLTVTYERRAEHDGWKKASFPSLNRLPDDPAQGRGSPGKFIRVAALDVFSDAGTALRLAAHRRALPTLMPIAAKPDTRPPTITIKGLRRSENVIEVFADALFIDGKVKDRGGVSEVTINDEEISDEEGKTIFFNYLVELDEGENDVVIMATDTAGNERKRVLTVTRKVPSVQQIGSRFTVAVLPFQIKGEADVAETVRDLFQEKLLDLDRFNLVSRESAAFEAALRELKLSQTGLVSKSAAVKVGRIIQAEGIINGTVREKEESLEVFLQLIDTETTKILAVHDVYGTEKSLENIEFLMGGLALKLQRSFPLLEGLVVKVDGDKIMLDLGRQHHVRREMRFFIYREGPAIKHPLTGKLMTGEPLELGLLRVTKVLKDSLVGKLASGAPDSIKELDKAIAK